MTKDGTPTYADLPRYAAIRSDELSGLLAPYVGMTDRYGEIVCRIVVALRGNRPHRHCGFQSLQSNNLSV
jgi:hypothetical protein